MKLIRHAAAVAALAIAGIAIPTPAYALATFNPDPATAGAEVEVTWDCDEVPGSTQAIFQTAGVLPDLDNIVQADSGVLVTTVSPTATPGAKAIILQCQGEGTVSITSVLTIVAGPTPSGGAGTGGGGGLSGNGSVVIGVLALSAAAVLAGAMIHRRRDESL